MLLSRLSSSSSQQGNATVETILVATVMVPLLTGIPLVGKMADINNTTAQSSRYLAWEQTVAAPNNHKSPELLNREVNNRFFARPDLQIRTDRETLTADEQNNPFWTGFGYNEDEEVNRMITLGEGLHTEVRSQTPDSLAGSLSTGITTMGNAMAHLTGGDWNLESQGLYTGSVSIEVAGNSIFSSGEDCSGEESETVAACVTRSNTIFTDSWDAQNPSMAARRSRTFVPAGALEPVGNTLASIASLVPFLRDIEGLRADGNGGFGYVNPNVLPMDRYVED